MSKNVLIGVGGSGQHVVHAYLRLLALSNAPASTIPHVYIIDADAKKSTASGSDVLLGRNIDDLHQKLTASLDDKVRPKCVFIMPAPDTQEQGAKKALGFNHEAGWANVFLLEDDVSVQVSRGMMANARVGASVFGVNKETLTRELKFPQNSQIAIVGSTFGGTGSGVIPELVRFLDDKYKTSTGTVIRAFMTLPWFEIDSSGVSAESKSAASIQQDDINPMERNASLGLRTYLDDSKMILKQSNYLVSQFAAGAVRTDGTNFNQDENPHVFNLVIANAIHNFLQGDDEVKDYLHIKGQSTGRNMFTFGVNEDEFIEGIFSAKTSPHLNVKIANNQKRSLEDIVRNAELWALVLEKGALYIQPGNTQFVPNAQSTKHDEPAALKGFLKQVAIKKGGSEKKEDNILLVEKKSGLFSKEVVANDVVYEELAKQLKRIADVIRGSLLWLEHHEQTGLHYSRRIPHLFTPPLVSNDYRTLRTASLDEGDLKKSWSWVDYNIDSITRKQTKTTITLNDNTPYIARAFTLLSNVFFNTEGSAETTLVKSLNELIKTYARELMSVQEGLDEESATKQIIDQRIYELAAQVIAKKVYEEVVDCRKHSASQNDTASVIMLKEEGRGEAIKPEDTNTSTVKIIPVHGFKDAIDVLHDKHPLSVRHLDPYIGIRRISQLLPQNGNPAEKIFPETALKGIPNIVAPKLLQKWRLELEFTPSDKTQPIKTEVPIRLKSYGMFLHARRVIEAAFWVLFTKHNQLELKEHSFPDNCKFSKLIKKTLVDDSNSSVLCIQYKDGDIVFVSDPELGWYLAANKAARKFLAEVMPELPSVKYGHSKLDSLWRGEDSQTTPVRQLGNYDNFVIDAFLSYMQEISNNSQSADNRPAWLRACDDLIKDLQDKGFQAQTSILESIALQNRDIVLVLLGQEVPITLKRLQGAENASLSSLAIPNPIFYYKTDNNDNLSQLQTKELLWPLKGMAWQYLQAPQEQEVVNDFGGVPKLLSNLPRTRWAWESLTLNFKNLGKKTFNKPFNDVVGVDAREDQFLWSVGVWPNFVLDDWSYYIAIGDFNSVKIKNIDLRGHDLQGETVEFIFYGDTNGQFQELGRSLHAIPIKLKGVPRSVEVVLGGRVLGSVPISLKGLVLPNNNTGECSIALDFGTSNTCMAIKISGENEVYTLPLLEGQKIATDNGQAEKPCSLTEMTWSAGNYVSGQKYYHQLLPTLFFQSFAAQAAQSAAIPSELLWAKGLGASNSDKRIEFLQGANQIKDYYSKFSLLEKFGHSDPKKDFNGELPIVVPFWTAFPPAINQSLRDALAKTDGNNRYVDNFKWANKALGDRRYAYRAAYLESIMVACFTTLRIAGYKRVNQLIATYPGAFTAQAPSGQIADTISYLNDLTKIVNSLAIQSGISFTNLQQNQNIILRSETCAALAGCKRNSHEVALTIDMGGGTTDIGLLIPLMVDGQETMQSYMASLRYAGNDLLKAIVAYDLTKPENKDKKSDTQLLEWKLSLREGTKRGSGTDTQAYNRIAMAFFEGLFEYVFNLLTAYQTNLYDKPINVYLLGNGFRLAQYFCCTGAAGKEKEEELAFFKQMELKAKTVNALPNNITLELKQQGLDKKRALIEGVFNVKTGTLEGEQYLAIEGKGYDAQPLLLPCVRVSTSTAHIQPVLIQKEAMQGVQIATDRPTRESAFKLTNKYWQHQDVNPDALFTQIVLATDGADLGKFYLENKFVPDVLFKLVKEQQASTTQQPQIQVNVSIPAPPPTPPQQSGFNPSAVSESVAAPPAPNLPPQNPNHSASTIPLSSGANTPINGDNITITLNWQSPFDLDVIAFALNEKGKVTADENTIFYNQPNYTQGAVLLNVAQRQLNIVLSKIPSHIKTIAICAVTGIDDESARGKTFGQVSHSKINVSGANNIVFELNNVKGTETAMIFGEVYRHNNTWKFRAKGQGYAGGFKKMCDEYGAEY